MLSLLKFLNFKNFTSIIGANGSGKSNVIDALLFVFGYKAAKIRCKKVSVLIHSSAGRENLRSCTVAIHFQKIVYPKSKVTRIYYLCLRQTRVVIGRGRMTAEGALGLNFVIGNFL